MTSIIVATHPQDNGLALLQTDEGEFYLGQFDEWVAQALGSLEPPYICFSNTPTKEDGLRELFCLTPNTNYL